MSNSIDRWVPRKRTTNEDYSVYNRNTDTYSFIQQGFGVCDRICDVRNGLDNNPPGEIAELAKINPTE